jgi:transposase
VLGAGGDAERPSYAELQAEIAERDAQITQLEAKLERMLALVFELKARLSKNSRNSSKPPSSDGLSKPPADAEQKNKRSLRRPSGRKPGGQEGHEGAHLQRAEVPDEPIAHEPQCCDSCGGALGDAERLSEHEESRQVFDLPEQRALQVIEHTAVRRLCDGCGQVSAGRFPAGVNAPVSYGPRIRALAVYLHVFQHLPYDRARQLILDTTGTDLSTATIKAWVDRAGRGLSDFDEQLRQLLCQEPVVNFDETGARIAGRLGWVHSASTETLTRYTAHAKRGVKAMDCAGVLPDFSGVAVHDGWSPYQTFKQATHALCAGHHLRELLAASEAGQGWASQMSALLWETNEAAQRAQANGLAALCQQALFELHARYRAVIASGYEQNPGLAANADKRIKRTDAQNLLLRLDSQESEALRFAQDLRVPFTNNLAERDIRMVKLQQKISGSWRTGQGARHWMAIRSYISTARKQGQQPLEVLAKLASGQPWAPAPAPG